MTNTMTRLLVRVGPTLLLTFIGAGGCGGGGGSGATDARDAGGADVEDSSVSVEVLDSGTGTEAAPDLPPPSDGGPEEVTPVIPTLTVVAAQNVLALDACNVTPSVIADVPAGSYKIELVTSTLSKGSVTNGPDDLPFPAVDNFVIVNLPLGVGDPQEARRFITLNGVGASADLTLTAPGTIRIMFIDSDAGANAGEGTVTLTPGGYSTTVRAATNVLRWQEGCASTPATLSVTSRSHRATLVESTLSSGAGSRDDFVVLRLPSEKPMDDHRYVILNGVGASHDFTPFEDNTVRAWFIGATGGGTGQAKISVTDL
jgi:hypothetical protein